MSIRPPGTKCKLGPAAAQQNSPPCRTRAYPPPAAWPAYLIDPLQVPSSSLRVRVGRSSYLEACTEPTSASLRSFRYAMATSAPSRAYASAIARPMPESPPVISATCNPCEGCSAKVHAHARCLLTRSFICPQTQKRNSRWLLRVSPEVADWLPDAPCQRGVHCPCRSRSHNPVPGPSCSHSTAGLTLV